MSVIPEISGWTMVDDSSLPVLVVQVNFDRSVFSGVYYESGEEEIRENLPFHKIEKIVEAAEAKQRLKGEYREPSISIKLTPREEAQFLMARAGELASQGATFVLGGTKPISREGRGD